MNCLNNSSEEGGAGAGTGAGIGAGTGAGFRAGFRAGPGVGLQDKAGEVLPE